MPDLDSTIRHFYDGWDIYNTRIVEVIREMSAEQLGVRPAPDRWPIWATVGHTAGARVFWLCGVLGEPGAGSTPFPDPMNELGWEDDLESPRGSDELVFALESTWEVVDRCLGRWTVESLSDRFSRITEAGTRSHTRQSVLMRLLSHDSYHCGDIPDVGDPGSRPDRPLGPGPNARNSELPVAVWRSGQPPGLISPMSRRYR
jgi:uncharacterized damage-inducible protein DinB